MAVSSPVSSYDKIPLVDATNEAPPPPYPVQITQPGVHLPQLKPSLSESLQEPTMTHINTAIFTILCCFWPLGLVALLKAIRGMQAHYNGDSRSADVLNKSSRRWTRASIIVGIIIIINIVIGTVARVPAIVFSARNNNSTDIKPD